MITIRLLLKYTQPYRYRLIAIFSCMLGIALLGFFTIGSLQPVIDLLFPPADGKIPLVPPLIENLGFAWVEYAQIYAMNHRWQVFFICCGIIIFAGLLKFIFSYGQEFLLQYLSEKVMLDIRRDLYSHLHNLSLRFFNQKDTGTQMARVTFDVDIIGRSIVSGFGEIIKEPLIMLGLLILMFLSHWQLALITLIFFPLISYPLIQFGHKIRVQSRLLQEERAQLNKLLLETISGIRIVKAFGTEEYEIKRFSDRVKKLFHTTARIIRINALAAPLTEFFGVIGIVSSLLLAAYFVAQGELTVGRFTTFLVALISFYTPLKRLSSANNQVQLGLAGAERVFQFLNIQPDIKDIPNAKILHKPKQEIQFNHLYFEYDPNIPVLQDIHITLPLNKIIAIVGPSGAGKSTLVNLIPRFYDPTKGYISIDGYPIQEIQLKNLRSHIGMVTQDAILFDDSIFNNIAYGIPDIDTDKVYQAARIAHADEFIRNLSDGYHTLIGERGIKLSGGQKQRITIARAILKNPAILIFDEATSSLDAESEQLVQDALEQLMVNRTTFIIAHRLSTILRADIILVLHQGRLVESGIHKDLLQHNGIYTKLYQTQFAVLD